jgi:hypothetical protein
MGILLFLALSLFTIPSFVHAQAWRDCVSNSIGPGGCDSIGPGGGLSIGPGGGQALDRGRTKGLDPNTMRPYNDPGSRPDNLGPRPPGR